MSSKIYVARLGKTIGLQGHLRLFIESDFPSQFKKGATFTTNRDLKLTIQEYNSNKNLVRFENYLDIELAKTLTNQELFTTIEDTKKQCILKENEFFWFDLIGCKIYENDLYLGQVKDVHRFPLGDYLEIATQEELVSKKFTKTFLIPHIFDKFILKVDITNKKIETINAFDILENS